jgi:hypothetical protein
MRGTRTLSFFCVLATSAPGCVEARSERVHGARAVALLPEQLRWTGQDRAGIDRGKAVDLTVDGGNAGWSLDFLSLRSVRPGDAECCVAGGRFSGKQAGFQAWHDLGGDDVVRLGAHLGKTSRRTLSPVTFPAKSRASYADAQLSWEHGERWSASAGWYRQGGWGGRTMDLDAVRLENGEAAAASGMRAAVRLAVGDARREARSWLTLEAREGSRAVGIGAGMRHASDVGLALTSMF